MTSVFPLLSWKFPSTMLAALSLAMCSTKVMRGRRRTAGVVWSGFSVTGVALVFWSYSWTWSRHTESGEVALVIKSNRRHTLRTERRHHSAVQLSDWKSSSLGVDQSAWRIRRATLACILSSVRESSLLMLACHTGQAYSIVGLTQVKYNLLETEADMFGIMSRRRPAFRRDEMMSLSRW